MTLARKLAKYPNSHNIFSRKINKIPEFYIIFARKIPEFFLIIARKYLSRILWGHVPPLLPRLLYAYECETNRRLWSSSCRLWARRCELNCASRRSVDTGRPPRDHGQHWRLEARRSRTVTVLRSTDQSQPSGSRQGRTPLRIWRLLEINSKYDTMPCDTIR